MKDFKKTARGAGHAAAVAVRVMTIPPVMMLLLAACLMLCGAGVYETRAQAAVSAVCLALVPALAYPLSQIIPKVREKGREGQRGLAFVTTAAGYLLAVLYAAARPVSAAFWFFHLTYLLSLLALLLFNRVFRVRASGHACGVTGPAGFAVLYLPWWAGALGLALYAFSAWASVRAKRHTPREFFLGTFCCLAAALLSAKITGVI